MDRADTPLSLFMAPHTRARGWECAGAGDLMDGGGGGGGHYELDPDALIRTFPVAAGESIGAGDVVSFVEGSAQRGFGVQLNARSVFIEGGMETGQVGVL